MALFHVWGMYKFDITTLAGQTVDTAEFNWYLENENITNNIGLPLFRAQSLNGTDDQDWTTADTAGKLYNNICEFTRSNFSFIDRIQLTATPTLNQYYQWDVATGLQAAIDDGDDFFTAVISRDVTQGTGTITKSGAGNALGVISRGGSTETVNWTTSEGVNVPFIDFTLVASTEPLHDHGLQLGPRISIT